MIVKLWLLMENYILYEQLGSGSRSVVYKGRRKGTLKYVAIVCADKSKRPEIANHVRLSQDLDHPNIVQFYEWYESNNHLWLVVELCTGGSLDTVIVQDGYLLEDVVRSFGWNLVKGLKYIHEMGIILSDLTPTKIVLDGSCMLKFSNFCLSKLEDETMKDFYTLFSSPNEGDEKADCDNVRTRLQGSPVYTAPEVLKGSETSMSSDLWALGCILYYMYTGKPPFYSTSHSELKEMILYQEPPPPRQKGSLPCEDFQNLLKALLIKSPEKRIYWPELLDHPFWAPLVMEEDKVEQLRDYSHYGVLPVTLLHTATPDYLPTASADESPKTQSPITLPANTTDLRAVSSLTPAATDRGTDSQPPVGHSRGGALGNSPSLEKERIEKRPTEAVNDSKLTRVKKSCHTMMLNKSFTLDNISELQPKSGVDEDHTEEMFVLRRSCISKNFPYQGPTSQVNTAVAHKVSAGPEITSCIKRLLHTDADLTVTPIMDNPKVLKSCPVRFDPKTLCVPVYSAEKLHSLSDKKWTLFLSKMCSSLEEQNGSTFVASSTASVTPVSAARSKLNLLCYLCSVAGHEHVANKLINSELLPSLLTVLQQAPNWDIRSKCLRVMGLLALHCTELEEESPVSEAVTSMTDLLRENQRNNKVKHFLLPPLGEFLYLITSQEEKRGSPEGLWFVPAAAYTGLMRSLREGDDPVVHHIAAKAVENISTRVAGPPHPLLTPEIGSALWFLFTHSPVDAVRVTAISSLSRVTRVDPSVFLAVIDACGPAAVLESLAGAGSRVQQHLLTALATALVTSQIQTHRITQSRDLVLTVLRCLESASNVTRAKTVLLLLLLIQDNPQILLYCCQHRLVMYLERDLNRASPLKANPGQSGHLSQCLDLLIGHLCSTAPLILADVLAALRDVIGRRHPSTSQSRQLRVTLPTLSVVLELVSSQIFRWNIVNETFLAQLGLLLNSVCSMESNETNLASALGAGVSEDFIRTCLSTIKALSQHHALIAPHHCTVVDTILPPLTRLAFSKNVERSSFVLRVLSELSLVLLVNDDILEEENKKEEKEAGGARGERRMRESDDGEKFSSPVLALFTESLLPRYESLLEAAEPVPLYALKLLVSMTEYSKLMCRLIKSSRILPTVFQLITANSSKETGSVVVQNAVALLCNLTEDTTSDLKPLHHAGLMEVVVKTLSEAVVTHQSGDGHVRKTDQLVLPAVLELLHNVLKRTSVIVRSALKSQRLSCPAEEMEAAEKVLLANRPLSQLSTHLIHMLLTDDQEVWEESLQCLSLLVQLYGGQGHGPLSPSCLKSFSHALRTTTRTRSTRAQRTTLRIIGRLVQTADAGDWLKCPEGVELTSQLQDISLSNRFNADVIQLATEIVMEISRL
ncbi:serine/threonine-protein kinase ULK4 isoform X2 [Cynoglossus semilaevis]|uniref:serine/threonine-protein kinase ULK4 isoform X2 n=1 Tax=Cynoglossus semilaevis TaxID=244447 RepID=UPI000D62C3D1|nr:serine/threonine-protein kinase ULK4 isoform X2 [Cynoglossus semilaevis]